MAALLMFGGHATNPWVVWAGGTAISVSLVVFLVMVIIAGLGATIVSLALRDMPTV